MPLYIQKQWYSEEQLKSYPDTWFVFGDNEARKGKGGQALHCRGQPNCIGIRTKRAPLTDPSVYWKDKTIQANCRMVYQDFEVVISKLEKGDDVVFPFEGFGTGMALLKTNAPNTLRFIEFMTKYISSTYESKNIDKYIGCVA